MPIQCFRIHPLSIPLRRRFEHAAHGRSEADPIVVEVELADGTLGYGETLPRPYVTGETAESVIETLRSRMPDELLPFRPTSFPDALERIDALPMRDPGGCLFPAARAAVELALLDGYSRHFRRQIAEAAGWLGLPGLGPPGSIKKVRYSGVLSGGEPARLRRKVRMMRWYGLRDFKLKVGYPDDAERVAAVAGALGRSLGRTTTLRLDANGAWAVAEAIQRLTALSGVPIACVEQPLDRSRDEDLAELRRHVTIDLMPDESLITLDDARRLAERGLADRFNIRISKNGGFLPALRLAHFARQNAIGYQLGCMVGETSILSAAGRRFLENMPGVTFAEGSYGRFLLSGDVVEHPVQFGCGGRPVPLSGFGWGVDVRPELLDRHRRGGAVEIRL